MKRLIIGISAADGISLALRLLKQLKNMPEVETHLVLSPRAAQCLRLECGMEPEELYPLADFHYPPDDIAAPISSGSYHTDGMIIIPCSMGTLGAIASGLADNLLTRSADVCMKERRPVVLMARETPLNLIHLKNMTAAAEAGCVIMPPVLTFYCRPENIEQQIDHLLGKALALFGIVLPDFRPWSGGNEKE